MAVAALLREPRMKFCPLAPKAIEVTPNTRASTNASPNTIEAVLPTHATLLSALLTMSCAPSPRVGAE
jgi:hypothetical protein